MRQRRRTSSVPVPTEQEEHRVLARWLDMHRIVWIHPPLGGYRKRIEAAILHGLGARAGVPDFLVFTPPATSPDLRGVAIELKRRGREKEKGGGVSPDQTEWMERLTACGWAVRVCYGADEAIEWLQSLGYGKRWVV